MTSDIVRCIGLTTRSKRKGGKGGGGCCVLTAQMDIKSPRTANTSLWCFSAAFRTICIHIRLLVSNDVSSKQF